MNDQNPSDGSTLRQQAEEQLQKRLADQKPAVNKRSADEMQQALHELQVHQIELEMQNEELRRARLELDAEHARYFDLYDLAPVGYVTISDKGLILEANLTTTTLLSAPKSQLVARPVSQFILKEDQDRYYVYLRKLQDGSFPQPCALRLVKLDGRVIWVQLAGGIITVAGSATCNLTLSDITQRKQAEEALLESEMSLRAFFNSSGMLCGIVEVIKGDILHVIDNVEAARFFGRTVTEMVDRTSSELGVPDEIIRLWIARYAESERTGQSVSFEYVHSQGSEPRYLRVKVSHLFKGLRGPRHAYVIEDITRRKQAEHALEASNRQLVAAAAELGLAQQQVVQQASLRALGQMASGVAHDFNNALSPIIGFSELLLKHPEQLTDQEKSLRFLQIINTAGRDAADVVRRLREFGHQRTAGEITEAIDLAGLAEHIIELTQPRWKDQAQADGITIQMVTDLGKVPPIAGEESAIREVLTNLIFNAVDALPAGGIITLGTELDGEFVKLWVGDTGVGMTEEVRLRCFEPFFTTKADKGTGLGLAMVHGIVQRHGGTVEIASAPGQGTTVTMRLPIMRTVNAVATPAGALALVRSLRVLVVDDEPMLQAVVEAYLTSDGHWVVTASSGALALPLLKAGQFDLVITDKAMPDMNGEQLAVAIQALNPALPVILMTGFGDLMKAQDKMPLHIKAILSKPITEKTLRAALLTVFPPPATGLR